MIMILLKTDGSWLVIASTQDPAAAAPEAVLTDAEGHAVADADNQEIETQDPP